MRIAHYLHVDKRLKSLRTEAGISQKDMAAKLELSVPTYSNYENGYSEPPMEVIQKFCSILNTTEEDFFGFSLKTNNTIRINTFADILKVIMEIKNADIPIECSTAVNQDTRKLIATINIESPQIAALVSRWNELNRDLDKDIIDTDDYNIWIDSLLNSFNIPIENF